MIIQGQTVTRITLDGTNATTIQYAEDQELADIVNMGPGDVYISWEKTATIGDVNCLLLTASGVPAYELRPNAQWHQLSIIGSSLSVVQVVVK